MNLFRLIFTTFLIVVPLYSSSMDMKQTTLFSTATGALCKAYAEEVGGDVEAFSEMNLISLQFAEKMGYVNDFQSYIANIHNLKTALQKELLKVHGSKLAIYNNWCVRAYNGFRKGITASNQ